MSSLPWTPRSGQAWAPGSVWSWASRRLHFNWTARLTSDNEERLILTQSDELSRVYSEGTRLPSSTFNSHHDDSKRTSQDGIHTNQEDAKEQDGTSGVMRKKKKTYRLVKNVERTRTQDGGELEAGSVIKCSKQMTCKMSQVSVMTLNSSPTITAWEAGWNVTNAIQGIFVLDLPFALVHSGYLGLLMLVLSAWVCNYTGRILVSCLYEEGHCGGPRVRVRHSYQDIAETCCRGLCPRCPSLGGGLVNVAQLIELLMTCTLYLVVSTSLLSDSLSGLAVPRLGCSLVSLLFLMPCLLLTDLRPVSTLSLFCSLAHIIISLLVMFYCLSRAHSWVWSSLSLSVDPEEFLVSVGVIIFSYTSQIFLPSLEGSMEDRGQFEAMLSWTHGAACVMKTLFALVCVLTWGGDTSEVITENLIPLLRPLVNMCLLVKALLSFPLPFYSAAEILQAWILKGSRTQVVTRLLNNPWAISSKYIGVPVSIIILCHVPNTSSHPKPGYGRLPFPALLLRAALLFCSLLLALLMPRFSLLMGLTGSVTGAAMTLILPCVFHLQLQWHMLSTRGRLTDVCVLGLGVLCCASGMFCSVKRLLQGL